MSHKKSFSFCWSKAQLKFTVLLKSSCWYSFCLNNFFCFRWVCSLALTPWLAVTLVSMVLVTEPSWDNILLTDTPAFSDNHVLTVFSICVLFAFSTCVLFVYSICVLFVDSTKWLKKWISTKKNSSERKGVSNLKAVSPAINSFWRQYVIFLKSVNIE